MLGFENVPKGKKLKYYKDYYLIPSIILLIAIFMVVSIIKVTVFREKEDLNIMIAAASTDLDVSHTAMIENAIIENFDVDFDGNGKEKLIISEAIMSAMGTDYRTAEQDMAAGMKLSAILEGSLCTIQLVDENIYQFLLKEEMIETYENLEKYGFLGEGYIKIPLSETKLDPKNLDPLYITIRPEASTRLRPEIYQQHIELVKQIIK